MNIDGAEADAQLAEMMIRRLIIEAELTLRQAVQEAPLESQEDADRYGGQPGELRASGRIVYLVNEAELESPAAAITAVRTAARARRLYRAEAELRFETRYARRQHDQLQLQHETGKARYLEDPIKAAHARLGAGFRAAMVRFEQGQWVHRAPGERSR